MASWARPARPRSSSGSGRSHPPKTGSPHPRRAPLLAELVERGELLPVSIEGIRGVHHVVTDELPLLAQAEREVADGRPPGGARPSVTFLAPLDPLAWDRNLLRSLFGFDYLWEVYVPAARRRWGYYVLPLLFGDRFVGRIEPRFERSARAVRDPRPLVGGRVRPARRGGVRAGPRGGPRGIPRLPRRDAGHVPPRPGRPGARGGRLARELSHRPTPLPSDQGPPRRRGRGTRASPHRRNPWPRSAPPRSPGTARSPRARGTIDYVTSGAFARLPVTWASRTEAADGRTSPEELLASAHASCYSMSLSGKLGAQRHPAGIAQGDRDGHVRQGREPAGASSRRR